MAGRMPPYELCGELSEAEIAELCCILHIGVSRGLFSWHIMDYRLPCTGGEGRTCQIVHKLSIWNEFLCHIGLELRYLSEGNGQLCLYTFTAMSPDLRYAPVEWPIQVIALLRVLLKAHRCITSIYVNLRLLKLPQSVFLHLLEGNQSVKRLLLGVGYGDIPKAACAAVSSLTTLEEFECPFGKCSPQFFCALSTLIRSTPLTVLKLGYLKMDETLGQELLNVLRECSALRELSLHETALSGDSRQALTRLINDTATLASVTVKANSVQQDGRSLNNVLWSVIETRTLATLTLRGFEFDDESIMLVGRILSENDALRALHIVDILSTSHHDPGSSYDCWFSAVAGSDTLEELTLPLYIWTAETWKYLFTLLANRTNMKTLNIQKQDVEDATDLELVYRALEESGQEEKVSFGTCHVRDYIELVECGLTVEEHCCVYMLKSLMDFPMMPSAERVTSLCVGVNRDDLEVSAALASYLEAASGLRFLTMCIESGYDFPDSPNAWWTIILQSLSQNQSIQTLRFLFCAYMEGEELEALADVVRESPNIAEVTVISGSLGSSVFTQCLAEGIEDNRTLLSVNVSDRSFMEATDSWFAVRDTARRNAELLTRAALFAKGLRFDRFHASALEEVASDSTLVKRLGQLASIKEEDAFIEVRSALCAMKDMNNFMRLVGVVKERVVCYPREDQSMQLVDLHEHCWRLISQYLSIDDVALPQRQHQSSSSSQEAMTLPRQDEGNDGPSCDI